MYASCTPCHHKSYYICYWLVTHCIFHTFILQLKVLPNLLLQLFFSSSFLPLTTTYLFSVSITVFLLCYISSFVFQLPHTDVIIQHLFFSIWVASLSVINSRPFISHKWQYFCYLYGWVIFWIYINHIFLIHSSIGKHFASIITVTANNAPMNFRCIYIYIFSISGFPGGSAVKDPPANAVETWVTGSTGREYPLRRNGNSPRASRWC